MSAAPKVNNNGIQNTNAYGKPKNNTTGTAFNINIGTVFLILLIANNKEFFNVFISVLSN